MRARCRAVQRSGRERAAREPATRLDTASWFEAATWLVLPHARLATRAAARHAAVRVRTAEPSPCQPMAAVEHAAPSRPRTRREATRRARRRRDGRRRRRLARSPLVFSYSG